MLTQQPWGRSCCAHFTDEKPEAHRLNNLPNVPAGSWRNENLGPSNVPATICLSTCLPRPTELILLVFFFKKKTWNGIRRKEKKNQTFICFQPIQCCVKFCDKFQGHTCRLLKGWPYSGRWWSGASPWAGLSRVRASNKTHGPSLSRRWHTHPHQATSHTVWSL